MSGEGFLSRWSRLKRKGGVEEAERGPAAPRRGAAAPVVADPAPPPDESDEGEAEKGPDLPPIEDLTLESDYKPFMDPKVPEAVRQAALRKLWAADPIFAAPDPLDIHNLDYTFPTVPEVVTTAYKVGRGFLDQVEAALDSLEGTEKAMTAEGGAEADENASHSPVRCEKA